MLSEEAGVECRFITLNPCRAKAPAGVGNERIDLGGAFGGAASARQCYETAVASFSFSDW